MHNLTSVFFVFLTLFCFLFLLFSILKSFFLHSFLPAFDSFFTPGLRGAMLLKKTKNKREKNVENKIEVLRGKDLSKTSKVVGFAITKPKGKFSASMMRSAVSKITQINSGDVYKKGFFSAIEASRGGVFEKKGRGF